MKFKIKDKVLYRGMSGKITKIEKKILMGKDIDFFHIKLYNGIKILLPTNSCKGRLERNKL